MAIREVSIATTLPSQEDLRARREHCSADPQTLAAIGRAGGQQVRVVRNDDDFALYTVSEVRQESPDDVVRMGLLGRRRLGTDDRFDGALDSQVVHPTISDADARACGEFVERLDDDGRQCALIAIAPHGGSIERYTDEQAEHVGSRLAVSAWRCKGYKHDGGALERWHITSTDINEASFPLLNSVITRGFAHAVAFHGFDDEPGILIGGMASDCLKRELRAAIEAALTGTGLAVRIAAPDERFGGDDPGNVVNRLSAGGANGVQIEQSLKARADRWRAIADAVADVYAAKLDYAITPGSFRPTSTPLV